MPVLKGGAGPAGATVSHFRDACFGIVRCLSLYRREATGSKPLEAALRPKLLARSRSSAEARSRTPGSKPLFGSKPYTWLEAALGSKPLFDSTPKTWPGAALRLAPGRRSNSASMLFMPHPLCGAEGGSRLPGILHGARLVVGSAEVDVFWCGQRCNKTPSHSGPVRMLARQHQSRNIH